MSRYTPIACALHESLELAILTARGLRVSVRPGGSDASGETLVLEPLDLAIAEGAEWLIARDAEGRRIRIRLDWILYAEPCP